MTYTFGIVFIETSLFTKLVPKYLSDDEYKELQQHLMLHPDAGDLIRGSGGIRKVRWAQKGRGKSKGIRMIYYWAKSRDQIYLLTIYSKSDQADIDKITLTKIARQLEKIK